MMRDKERDGRTAGDGILASRGWSIALYRPRVTQKSDALRTQQIRNRGNNQGIIFGTDLVLNRLNQFIEARRDWGALLSGAARGKDGFHTYTSLFLGNTFVLHK